MATQAPLLTTGARAAVQRAIPATTPAAGTPAAPMFTMPSLQEIRVKYPGFKALVLAGGFRDGGIQPDTFFSNTPASRHQTQIPGGPAFDFVFVDGGHTLVCLRNGTPSMTTVFSTADGETFHYVMTNGMVIKVDLLWKETSCA